MGAAHLSHCRGAFFDNCHRGGNASLQQENQLFGGAQAVQIRRQLNLQIRATLPCATALNKNHQHDYKQHTCNYPDNCGTVHCGFLPLCKSYMRFHLVRSQGMRGANCAEFPGLRNCRTGQRHPFQFIWCRRTPGNNPR